MFRVQSRAKPIVRWNIGGNVSELGYDILKESIYVSREVFDKYQCRYVVCYNSLSKSQWLEINDLRLLGVEVRECAWEECPIPFQSNLSPRRNDGSFSDDTSNIGGTLWKITPSRLDINCHEIVMDNDIIVLNDFPELESFFSSSKTLVCANNARFYGRYEHLFKHGECFNAGFTGLPPGFDYSQAIFEVWDQNERLKELTYPDEQAISLAALRSCDHIVVPQGVELELFTGGRLVEPWPNLRWEPYTFNGNENILHFVQANRYAKDQHQGWSAYYKEIRPTKTHTSKYALENALQVAHCPIL